MQRTSLELERAALSLMLTHDDCTEAGVAQLSTQHFDLVEHQRVFAHIRDVYRETGRADITLINARADGPDWSWLQEVVNDQANRVCMPQYVQELDRLRFRRSLAAAMYQATKALEDGDDDRARDLVRSATDRSWLSQSLPNTDEQEAESLAQLDQDIHGGVVGITMGFPKLNELLCGFRPGGLYTLFADTGKGKTFLALQMALAASLVGNEVYWFSQEMSRKEMNFRLAGLMARVPTDPNELRANGREHEPALRKAIADRRGVPIQFDDRCAPLQEMLRLATDLSGKVKLFVFDPLQDIRVDGTKEIFDEIRIIMRDLKAFALQRGVAVLVVSHINREAGGDWDPKPHHLKGGSIIEQRSNVLMALARKPDFDLSDRQQGGRVTIWKNRGGKTGVMPVIWDRALARYDEGRLV